MEILVLYADRSHHSPWVLGPQVLCPIFIVFRAINEDVFEAK